MGDSPMKNMVRNLFSGSKVFIFLLTFLMPAAQESKVALPIVASAAVPLYPPLARAANIQGVVHVKVTTDGQRVVTSNAEDGHKLLAAAAKENAQTWRFARHEP